DKTRRYHVYRGIRLRTEKDEAEEANTVQAAERRTEPELPLGDNRTAPRQSANGAEPGLARARIQELADWYREQTSRRYTANTPDPAELDAELRAILQEEAASPEQAETEFQRVMNTALAM